MDNSDECLLYHVILTIIKIYFKCNAYKVGKSYSISVLKPSNSIVLYTNFYW